MIAVINTGKLYNFGMLNYHFMVDYEESRTHRKPFPISLKKKKALDEAIQFPAFTPGRQVQDYAKESLCIVALLFVFLCPTTCVWRRIILINGNFTRRIPQIFQTCAGGAFSYLKKSSKTNYFVRTILKGICRQMSAGMMPGRRDLRLANGFKINCFLQVWWIYSGCTFTCF